MTIGACLSALKFSASQTGNPEWLAVGLTTALKGALMTALSAYENADAEDILDIDRQGAASVSLLLRRASSADYLSEEHRLPLTSSKRKAILNLVAIRNQTLHILTPEESVDLTDVPRFAAPSLEAIRHLMISSPAFDTGKHGVDVALIADYLDRIEAAVLGER